MRTVSDACGHYPRGVPADHRCDARIVLIGDCPDQYAVSSGTPFVAAQGYRLQQWWKAVGLSSKSFYLATLFDSAFPNYRQLEEAKTQLLARLDARLIDPWLFVPTENHCLSALTGIKQKNPKDDIIGKWRGSILDSFFHGSEVKTIPTLHPQKAVKEPVLDKTCLFDWQRIAHESRSREIVLPVRNLVVQPGASERKEFLSYLIGHPEVVLSWDIETVPDDGIITCVAFAYNAQYGISVTWQDHRDFIKQVLELPNPKGGQNFMYDAYWVAGEGINVRNLAYDSGDMFHALDCNAGPATTADDVDDPNAGKSRIKPYSLAYMTSVFTKEPYYKEAGRDEDGRFMRVDGDPSKMRQLQEYNARDAVVTWEIIDVLGKRLLEANKLDFYREHYASLYHDNLQTMLHGVRVNVGKAEADSKRWLTRCEELKVQIAEIAGISLSSTKEYKRQPKDWTDANPEFVQPSEKALKVYGTPWVRITGKSISRTKLKGYLYGVLKLPARKRADKITVDEAALVGLRLQYPDECGKLVDALLEFYKTEKKAQFLAEGSADADGRIRCQYKFLVQTRRLSSTKNPRGTGLNLQNEPPEIMELLVPDVIKIDDITGEVTYE